MFQTAGATTVVFVIVRRSGLRVLWPLGVAGDPIRVSTGGTSVNLTPLSPR